MQFINDNPATFRTLKGRIHQSLRNPHPESKTMMIAPVPRQVETSQSPQEIPAAFQQPDIPNETYTAGRNEQMLLMPKSVAVSNPLPSPSEKNALFSHIQEQAGKEGGFPDPNEGYYGLHVFLLGGEPAATSAAFVKAEKGTDFDYLPEKHLVVATANSYDEPELGIYILERENHDAVASSVGNPGNYSFDTVQQFYPGLDEYQYGFQLVGTLASQGELLGVVEGEDTPDSIDFSSWK